MAVTELKLDLYFLFCFFIEQTSYNFRRWAMTIKKLRLNSIYIFVFLFIHSCRLLQRKTESFIKKKKTIFFQSVFKFLLVFWHVSHWMIIINFIYFFLVFCLLKTRIKKNNDFFFFFFSAVLGDFLPISFFYFVYLSALTNKNKILFLLFFNFTINHNLIYCLARTNLTSQNNFFNYLRNVSRIKMLENNFLEI